MYLALFQDIFSIYFWLEYWIDYLLIISLAVYYRKSKVMLLFYQIMVLNLQLVQVTGSY